MFKYEIFQPALLTTIPVAKQILKFASAPKPWVAFTNLHLTTLAILINRCSDFSLISLPASPRIISTILSIKIRMITPIIPTPIYLLSTPTIQLISLKISKMLFVQFQSQRTNRRHND